MFFTKKLTPLTYREVTKCLGRLGYEMKKKGSTGHEQWVLIKDGKKYLVTVDKHLAPFSKDLITLMARQAGYRAKEFHAMCKSKNYISEQVLDDVASSSSDN